jgi:hypothetical protein
LVRGDKDERLSSLISSYDGLTDTNQPNVHTTVWIESLTLKQITRQRFERGAEVVIGVACCLQLLFDIYIP